MSYNSISDQFLASPLFTQYENYNQFANFVNGQFGGAVQWDYQLFDTLYRTSWVAEKVVTIMADDMTDKWRTFHHPDPEVVRIRTEYEENNEIADVFRQAIMQSRLYGGSAIIPIIEGQFEDNKFKLPFDINSVKEGSLNGFQILTRYDFKPSAGINRDIFVNPKLFGDYIYYQIIRIQTMLNTGKVGAMTQEPPTTADLPTIHASRMIKFFGKELTYYQKFFSGGWGDSVLVPIIDKIPALEEAFHLIYLYLDSFNVDIFKIPNFAGLIKSEAGDNLIRNFKALRNKLRNSKMKIIDSGDAMERNQLSSIANTTPVFQSLIQFVVGATGVPITRILGTSVGGWSTGDNELTQYYDLVAQNQKRIRQEIKTVDEIIERHLFGKKMNIQYKFPPKREVTEKELAEIKKTQADTYAVYLQSRVMTPKVVAENIKQDYNGIDDAYIATLEEDFLDYESEMEADGDEEAKEQEIKEEESNNNSLQKANEENVG